MSQAIEVKEITGKEVESIFEKFEADAPEDGIQYKLVGNDLKVSCNSCPLSGDDEAKGNFAQCSITHKQLGSIRPATGGKVAFRINDYWATERICPVARELKPIVSNA